jgi:hypothetical protein
VSAFHPWVEAFIGGFKEKIAKWGRKKRMEDGTELMLCYYHVSYSSALSMEIYQSSST